MGTTKDIEACENNIAALHEEMALLTRALHLHSVQSNTLLRLAIERALALTRAVYEREKARRQALQRLIGGK